MLTYHVGGKAGADTADGGTDGCSELLEELDHGVIVAEIGVVNLNAAAVP